MSEFIRIQNKIDSLQHSESRYQLSSIGKELLNELQRIKKEHSEMLEQLEKSRQIIRSLKLSMLGHPDCTYQSEFDDLTTKAQQSEVEILKLIKEATEL